MLWMSISQKTASNCFGRKYKFEEMTTQLSQYVKIWHYYVKFKPNSPILIKLIKFDSISCKKGKLFLQG